MTSLEMKVTTLKQIGSSVVLVGLILKLKILLVHHFLF